MFGLSFPELLVVVIAAIVVIGPKDLPVMLRKGGQWAGKLRRMAGDLRAQSGIDDVLREGNLHHDINEIRKLARGELHDVMNDIRVERAADLLPETTTSQASLAPVVEIVREREHPTEGPDAMGAMPENAMVYGHVRVRSKFADDLDFTAGIPFESNESVAREGTSEGTTEGSSEVAS